MVLSILGALAGAGGGIASAILGAEASDNAAAWNNYINERNLRAQQKQQQKAYDYADQIRGEQKLGGRDALGNRTYFDDEEGWITELSPQQQALYDYFFSQELPELRSQFGRAAEHSRANSDQANALLNEFQRVRRKSPLEAESQLYLAATRGAGDAARDVSEAAMRQATRTGNSNIAQIIGQLGKASMDQRANARLNAQMQAEDYANDQYASQRGGLAQLYQMFLGAANAGLTPSYDPTGIAGEAGKNMGLFAQLGSQGNSMGFNAVSQPAPLMKNIEPNMGWANAAGAIGSSLSGLGTRLGGMQQQNQMNDLMKMYITSGGQLDLGGGGIFGTTADRLRQGGGLF